MSFEPKIDKININNKAKDIVSYNANAEPNV